MSEKGWKNVWDLSRRRVRFLFQHIIKGSEDYCVAGKDPKLDERQRRRLAVIKRIIKSPKQQKGNDISTRVPMYDYRVIVNTWYWTLLKRYTQTRDKSPVFFKYVFWIKITNKYFKAIIYYQSWHWTSSN